MKRTYLNFTIFFVSRCPLLAISPLLNYDFVSMFTINNFNEDW